MERSSLSQDVFEGSNGTSELQGSFEHPHHAEHPRHDFAVLHEHPRHDFPEPHPPHGPSFGLSFEHEHADAHPHEQHPSRASWIEHSDPVFSSPPEGDHGIYALDGAMQHSDLGDVRGIQGQEERQQGEDSRRPDLRLLSPRGPRPLGSSPTRWVDSHSQLADALTKHQSQSSLMQVLVHGSWTLTYDPTYLS